MKTRISMNALLILGILFCAKSSTAEDKARIFYTSVQPEFEEKISVMDQDLKMNTMFLIQCSTIIKRFWSECYQIEKDSGEMIDTSVIGKEIKSKIVQHTLKKLYKKFMNEMFTKFNNKLSREDMIKNLQ